jgi:hypothetical protein
LRRFFCWPGNFFFCNDFRSFSTPWQMFCQFFIYLIFDKESS